MRRAVAALSLVIAVVAFDAPKSDVAAEEAIPADRPVSADAQARALAEVEAEYGPIVRVFGGDGVIKKGRQMYEVSIEGRFIIVGPMTLEGHPARVRMNSGRITFDDEGMVWQIELSYDPELRLSKPRSRS